jgi:cytidylate kinase
MDHENVSQHLAAMQHLSQHWEARQKTASPNRPPGPKGFAITLAREAGTQGTAVAQEIGRLLGWQAYDHELLQQIGRDMGLNAKLLESVDERQRSWILESLDSFMSTSRQSDSVPAVTQSSFVHHLVKTVLALGALGECVIVGRGAAFILPVETTLRVRLVGPVKERIAALCLKQGISERDATRRLRTIDRERADFIQDHFYKDVADPSNYDLVVNAMRFSVPQMADLIVQALRGLPMAATRVASK